MPLAKVEGRSQGPGWLGGRAGQRLQGRSYSLWPHAAPWVAQLLKDSCGVEGPSALALAQAVGSATYG